MPDVVTTNRSKQRNWIVLIIAILGVGSSLFAFTMIQKADQFRLRTHFRAKAIGLKSALYQTKSSYIDALRLYQRLRMETKKTEKEDFSSFAGPLLAAHQGITEISWVTRVEAANRKSFERESSKEGLKQFRITEMGTNQQPKTRSESNAYFPICYIVPETGNKSRIGFDLKSDENYQPLLTKASQNKNGVGAVFGSKIRFFFPVNGSRSISDSPKIFQGGILATIDLARMVQEAFKSLDRSGIQYAIIDASSDSGQALFYSSSVPGKKTPSIAEINKEIEIGKRWESNLDFADIQLRLVCFPSQKGLAPFKSILPSSMLLFGLMLTGALVLFLMNSFRYTQHIEILFSQLQKSNRDLEQAHQELKDNQAKIIENAQLKLLQNMSHKMIRELRQPITTLMLALHLTDKEDSEVRLHKIVSDTVSKVSKLVESLTRLTGGEAETNIEKSLIEVKTLEVPSAPPPPSETKILIIEDEIAILELMGEIIQNEGYKTDTATTGEEGLKKIQSGEYNLVLADIVMPGLSGIDVYLQCKEIKSDQKFIFMSGYSIKEEWLPIVKECGVFLQKPCSVEQVQNALKKALET